MHLTQQNIMSSLKKRTLRPELDLQTFKENPITPWPTIRIPLHIPEHVKTQQNIMFSLKTHVPET